MRSGVDAEESKGFIMHVSHVTLLHTLLGKE